MTIGTMAPKRSCTRYIYMFLESLPWYLALLDTIYWVFLSSAPTTKLLIAFWLLPFLLSLVGIITFLRYRFSAQEARMADADRAFSFRMTKAERAFNDIVRSAPCAVALSIFAGWVWWVVFRVLWGIPMPFDRAEFWGDVLVALRWAALCVLGALWVVLGLVSVFLIWVTSAEDMKACSRYSCRGGEMEEEKCDLSHVEMGTVTGASSGVEGYSKVPVMEEEAFSLDGRTETEELEERSAGLSEYLERDDDFTRAEVYAKGEGETTSPKAESNGDAEVMENLNLGGINSLD